MLYKPFLFHIHQVVIYMDKTNENRKKETEENKKDYYVPVMLWQIILCVCAVLLLFFITNGKTELKNEIFDIMQSEIDYGEVSAAVQTAIDSLGEADSWAVFGDRVLYKTETDAEKKGEVTQQEITTEQVTALSENISDSVGGVDLKTYEAKQNTSFAPYKVTAPILSPIENGRYTSYFGYRINPITGEFSFHTGLDIAATKGTAIRAAWNGTVTKVGEDSQAGKYIFLEHDDGFVTFYCHCSEITAQKGAVIRQGETIAKVGSTGWSTGPHLHFEIRKNNIRMNPLWALENDC